MFQSFDYSMSLSTLVGIYANELFCFNGALVVTNVFIKTNVVVFYIQCYFLFQWGYLQ
jgi:hypothetical protein